MPAAAPRDAERPRARVHSTGALSLEVIQGGRASIVQIGDEPLCGRYLMKELFD
jgi:hypothetical protein